MCRVRVGVTTDSMITTRRFLGLIILYLNRVDISYRIFCYSKRLLSTLTDRKSIAKILLNNLHSPSLNLNSYQKSIYSKRFRKPSIIPSNKNNYFSIDIHTSRDNIPRRGFTSKTKPSHSFLSVFLCLNMMTYLVYA